MPELIPVLDKEAIDRKVADIARQISIDYKETHLILIGVLKGAFVFLADLARKIEVKRLTIDFVRAASYGSHDSSSGSVRLLQDVESDVSGQDLLIVEDILDTGLTATFLRDHLIRRGARTVKTCTMLDKPRRRRVDFKADYVAHTVTGGGFLVGYGLDYAEDYRHLPAVFDLKLE